VYNHLEPPILAGAPDKTGVAAHSSALTMQIEFVNGLGCHGISS
jgi:hypothetical protein